MYSVRIIGNNGLSTAVNATVGSTSASSLLAGSTVLVSVGSAAPIYIRFGAYTDTVTTSNGFLLAAGGSYRFTPPPNATHIHYIRENATDSKISLAWADGGV